MAKEMVVSVDTLKVGDVIKISSCETPYNHCTVKKVLPNDEGVILFRPYVHTSDFSYTGGIICYVGFEEYTLHSGLVYLVERRAPEIK